MHYHKSKFLRFANAAFEFLLLILTFIFAGWLRSYTPMGSQFFMWDIWTFLPISALYALVIVGCNAVLGSYRTLHMRNSIKQLFLIALTSLMGLALMATAFYVFYVSQLSRLLLVYYYLLSVIMIYLKRLVFDRLADAYVRKHDIVPRALLIGGGQLAHRFFRDVIEGRGSTAMQYVGYLDAARLSGYRGQPVRTAADPQGRYDRTGPGCAGCSYYPAHYDAGRQLPPAGNRSAGVQ